MALVDMKAMLHHAYENCYAVGAFDVIDLAIVAGVIDAAERCQAPVILSLAESHFRHYDFPILIAAVEAAARRASVPVAMHLDHGSSLESAVEAIRLGCNGVMVDASDRPFADNVTRTGEVVQMAHGCGVPVEGELGYVPGEEGESAELHPGAIAFTEVEAAVQYVQETGVDFLAVSIGTVHGRLRGEPKLDFERLDQINRALRIPLVIHGGTGLSDEQFHYLIRCGVAKINYFTALADEATAAARQNLAEGAGYPHLFQSVSKAVATETERCIRLWGGAGRAAELLSYCPAWEPVEHVVIYNLARRDEVPVEAMMAQGRRALKAIPGVRAIETGKAIRTAKTRYDYCWLVRFAHPAVIETYERHPLHLAFADNLFRPVAPDRITTDFHLIDPQPSAARGAMTPEECAHA